MGSGCGMFSDDIWAEATRMCRTAEERGLAPIAGKEEGGHVEGAREAVTGELEVDNL